MTTVSEISNQITVNTRLLGNGSYELTATHPSGQSKTLSHVGERRLTNASNMILTSLVNRIVKGVELT